jgi:putative NADH-flavin reductase
LVRNAATIQRNHSRLTVVEGTPANADNLEKALAGQDAVLSTLGARTNKRTTLRTDVARNLAAGMKKYGVRRLVWLDAAGVGASKELATSGRGTHRSGRRHRRRCWPTSRALATDLEFVAVLVVSHEEEV